MGAGGQVGTQYSGCRDTRVENKVGKGWATEGTVVQAGRLDSVQETVQS